jgi:predicted membrane protein
MTLLASTMITGCWMALSTMLAVSIRRGNLILKLFTHAAPFPIPEGELTAARLERFGKHPLATSSALRTSSCRLL